MSRRHSAEKREVLPDAKYGDITITKFMNCLMYSGKKSVAEQIVYGAFELIQKDNGQDPIKLFHEAMSNVKPTVEVRSRRVGGATYQVPMEVREDRRIALAIRWLIADMRGRREKEAKKKLQMTLLDAANNRGAAIKKREDTHRMAEANRAFSHFRW
jgi:small subunit ribosomal protein S7